MVYNAHLESRGSEQLRKVQIEEILADTRRYPADVPILIAGDFNTRRTSTPAIAALLETGFHIAVGQQVTTTRGSALDWIIVRGPLTFETGAIHNDTKASDHFPLTVVIHLDAGPSTPPGRPQRPVSPAAATEPNPATRTNTAIAPGHAELRQKNSSSAASRAWGVVGDGGIGTGGHAAGRFASLPRSRRAFSGGKMLANLNAANIR
jgi:hypothetical protein